MRKNVPGKMIGQPCTCKNQCFTKVGETGISAIFKEYWETADYNLQTAYLQRMIIQQPIKRKRTTNVESRKTHSMTYTVEYLKVKYTICKIAFLSIHGISQKRAEIARKKINNAGSTVKDQRGLGPNPNAKPKDAVDLVHKHIQQLKVMSSHYTRNKNPN